MTTSTELQGQSLESGYIKRMQYVSSCSMCAVACYIVLFSHLRVRLGLEARLETLETLGYRYVHCNSTRLVNGVRMLVCILYNLHLLAMV